MLNANFEPTYRTLDRTYHAVYNVSGQVYKTFLGDNLQVALDFTPLGNRRKLDRQAGVNKVSYKYTTPVQYVGFSLTWNFSGGKKVKVDIVDGIQDYHETKDNRWYLSLYIMALIILFQIHVLQSMDRVIFQILL